MKTLKWVDLGRIHPRYFEAIWEYGRIFKPKDTYIFSMIPTEPSIQIVGKHTDIKYLLSTIPSDVNICRFNMYNNELGSVFYVGSDMLEFHTHKLNPYNYHNEMFSAVSMMRKEGLNCFLKRNSRTSSCNDVFYIDSNNKPKKFAGFAKQKWDNGIMSTSFVFSYTIDYDFMDSTINFETGKIKKKENISSLREIIGGIREVLPDANIDEHKLKYVNEYASRLGCTIEKTNLTTEEKDIMDTLADELDTDDWKYSKIHPHKVAT